MNYPIPTSKTLIKLTLSSGASRVCDKVETFVKLCRAVPLRVYSKIYEKGVS